MYPKNDSTDAASAEVNPRATSPADPMFWIGVCCSRIVPITFRNCTARLVSVLFTDTTVGWLPAAIWFLLSGQPSGMTTAHELVLNVHVSVDEVTQRAATPNVPAALNFMIASHIQPN